MTFAENLQYLRRTNNITQEALAERLGVSRQSVSKWETGEAYPETEKIIALCDIFGVSMDELMRGDVAAGQAGPAPEEGGQDGGPAAEDAIPQEDGGGQKLRAIGAAITGGTMLCAVVTYLCLGILGGLWHPGWLVFPFALSLVALVDNIFGKEGDPSKSARPMPVRVLKGLAAMVMLASAASYLLIGCVFSLWHPGWVIMPCAVALVVVLEGIARAVQGKEGQ